MGETREQRIEQFLEENDVLVLGMREGIAGARLFTREADPEEIVPDSDLSWLLEVPRPVRSSGLTSEK